jgi:integrase
MSVRDPPDPDDPIEYFKEEMRLGGMAPESVRNYDHALAYLEEFLDERDQEAGDLTERDCKEFCTYLKDAPALSQTTAGDYAKYISKFYEFYNTRGTYEVNPMALALETEKFGNDTSDMRREISVKEMAEYLTTIDHPLDHTLTLTLAKTGARAAEVSNLDARDLYIDHAGIQREYPRHRTVLDGRPDSLYIPPADEMREGRVVNGEERTASNKRKRGTIIPIDDELKQVLIHWLAIRTPSESPAVPVFTIPIGRGNAELGGRLSPEALRHRVKRHAEEYGWWHQGAGVETNVTPHYFRHFFTTHMRERTKDDAFVKFIRGDVGGDIIETYSHAWGDKVETTYRKNIYKLLR